MKIGDYNFKDESLQKINTNLLLEILAYLQTFEELKCFESSGGNEEKAKAFQTNFSKLVLEKKLKTIPNDLFQLFGDVDFGGLLNDNRTD